jgi:hypothetical protein
MCWFVWDTNHEAEEKEIGVLFSDLTENLM